MTLWGYLPQFTIWAAFNTNILTVGRVTHGTDHKLILPVLRGYARPCTVRTGLEIERALHRFLHGGELRACRIPRHERSQDGHAHHGSGEIRRRVSLHPDPHQCRADSPAAMSPHWCSD